jgi:hypothetical protein
VDTSNSDLPADRDASGRFLPGRSGNPTGKKPGTRNSATEIRAMLAEGEETAVARTVIDKAKSGDACHSEGIRLPLKPGTRRDS